MSGMCRITTPFSSGDLRFTASTLRFSIPESTSDSVGTPASIWTCILADGAGGDGVAGDGRRTGIPGASSSIIRSFTVSASVIFMVSRWEPRRGCTTRSIGSGCLTRIVKWPAGSPGAQAAPFPALVPVPGHSGSDLPGLSSAVTRITTASSGAITAAAKPACKAITDFPAWEAAVLEGEASMAEAVAGVFMAVVAEGGGNEKHAHKVRCNDAGACDALLRAGAFRFGGSGRAGSDRQRREARYCAPDGHLWTARKRRFNLGKSLAGSVGAGGVCEAGPRQTSA